MTTIPAPYRSKTIEQAGAHLVEELAEALQAAAKGLRFGFLSVNPELPPDEQETNFAWLRREMEDVARAYKALDDLCAKDSRMTVKFHGDAGDLLKRLRTAHDRLQALVTSEGFKKPDELERDAVFAMSACWDSADCIEALEAECATWKDACHSAESRIEHFLTRTSGLESAERVVEAARVYMKIHKGPWPPDTYISRLDKALAAHDKETGA